MSDNKDINYDFMNDLETIYKSSKYFKKGEVHKLVFGDKNVFLPRFEDEEYKKLAEKGLEAFLQPLDLDYNWEFIGSLLSKVNKYFYLYKDKGRLHQQLKMVLPEEGNDIFNIENDPFKTAIHLTYETFVFIKIFCAKFNKNIGEIDKASLGLIPKREEYPTTTVLRERLNMLQLSLKCHDKDDKPISNKELFQFLDDNNYNRGDFLQFGPNLLFSFIFFEQFKGDKPYTGIYLELNENTQKYECPNMKYLFNMLERQISETETRQSLLSKLLSLIIYNNDYYLGQYFSILEQISTQGQQITIKQRLEYILIPTDKGSHVPFDGLISVSKKNKLTGPINRCFVFDFDKKNAAFTAIFPLVFEISSGNGKYLKDYLKERETISSTNTKKLPILKIFKINDSLPNDDLLSDQTKELLKIILKYNKLNKNKK